MMKLVRLHSFDAMQNFSQSIDRLILSGVFISATLVNMLGRIDGADVDAALFDPRRLVLSDGSMSW